MAPASRPQSAAGGEYARAAKEIPDLLRQMGVEGVDEDRHRDEILKIAKFALGMKSDSSVAEILAALIMGAESGEEGRAPSMSDVMAHLAFSRTGGG